MVCYGMLWYDPCHSTYGMLHIIAAPHLRHTLITLPAAWPYHGIMSPMGVEGMPYRENRLQHRVHKAEGAAKVYLVHKRASTWTTM